MPTTYEQLDKKCSELGIKIFHLEQRIKELEEEEVAAETKAAAYYMGEQIREHNEYEKLVRSLETKLSRYADLEKAAKNVVNRPPEMSPKMAHDRLTAALAALDREE